MRLTLLLLSLSLSAKAFSICNFKPQQSSSASGTRLYDAEISAQAALERTASHLEKLKHKSKDPPSEEDQLYQSYIQRPANSLKEELKQLGLPRTGRKPDLAKRLVEHELKQKHATPGEEESRMLQQQMEEAWKNDENVLPLEKFAGLKLSLAAGKSLASARFDAPSPIQEAAIPSLAGGESAILHAETGSGKTLAYLLPVTEQLWREVDDDDQGFCVILTPTRELAAQVAGIAQVLAPPGSVRLIFRPTNLLGDPLKEHGEEVNGGLLDRKTSRSSPRLYVGSAKAIMTSLYGDEKMPASPTTKPEAMFFLRNVRWLILDEVDRLLHVKKSRGDGPRFKQHEKPAAVVTSAVARMSLGRAQVIAVSATVGRPLRRELSRVLGLSTDECPRVIRGSKTNQPSNGGADDGEDDSDEPVHLGRAVSIPDLVESYVTTIDSESSGKLMTAAFEVVNRLNKKPRKMLMVLTRGCGMSTKNTIGALKHFQCKPEPVSLLDALEADGSDHMIAMHRQVSGAVGIGETNYFKATQQDTESGGEYLLVTGEDTVRGLHLDGLDVVIVVGQPHGPDEYTHIAGRTGRAGKPGKVINVVSADGAAHFKSWERMLNVQFESLKMEDIGSLP